MRTQIIGYMMCALVLSFTSSGFAASTGLAKGPRVSFVFDDGLASAIDLAEPTLAKYGLVGTDFVITGCVGMTTVKNTCNASNDYPYMTWQQIGALKTAGWEIASHTVTHPYLATNNPPLTEPEVITELSQSLATFLANGYVTTDFATPYGDYEPNGHPVLADIAKYYASHRGFKDTGLNTYPYNDYLIYDEPIQGNVSVATAEGYINAAVQNNQWLVLTFHHIVSSGASTDMGAYEYNVADLDTIAKYVHDLNIPVVTMSQALVTNSGNMFVNSSFDSSIGKSTGDTSVWSTDDPTNVKQDTGSNGSYPSIVNSISISSSPTASAHLFSPRVCVSYGKSYVLKTFLDVVSNSAGSVVFYVDEYDRLGRWINGAIHSEESTVFVENINFEYTPSSSAVHKARLQVALDQGSLIHAYVDNAQMFAEDGSTTTTDGSCH